MSFVIDAVWYSFIGYRVGDADGTGKLLYLARQLRSRLGGRRLDGKPSTAAAEAAASFSTEDPNPE
jgi:hypothetical protein